MCGRYAIHGPHSRLAERFRLDECVQFGPRYNVAPSTDIPVIRQSPDGRRVLHLLRCGLVPHWAKDPAAGARLVNARPSSSPPSTGRPGSRRGALKAPAKAGSNLQQGVKPVSNCPRRAF